MLEIWVWTAAISNCKGVLFSSTCELRPEPNGISKVETWNRRIGKELEALNQKFGLQSLEVQDF